MDADEDASVDAAAVVVGAIVASDVDGDISVTAIFGLNEHIGEIACRSVIAT